MKDTQLVDLFQRARHSHDLAIIEGVQALKHAVRFQADIQRYITCDIDSVRKLLGELTDDITYDIFDTFQEVSETVFTKLSPNPHRTKVIALATRHNYQIEGISPDKPIIFLEDPKDLENIGAVIRVAAAADAGAVIISGNIDIWHPAVIRGAAGLHWAIPVFNTNCHPQVVSGSATNTQEVLKQLKNGRQLIALDPTGKDINGIAVPKNAILIFGTERYGISRQLLDQSDKIVRLPMKTGVSSLNLATSVAATLYRI